MKKQLFLLIISSFFYFPAHASAKKSGISKDEIAEMTQYITDQRNAHAERLLSKSPKELVAIIAGTEFEKAGMADTGTSKKNFRALLARDHRLAFAAAYAYTDLRLLKSQEEKFGTFYPEIAIAQSVSVSIELANAAFKSKE